jgi:hypothetical protein
MLQFPYITVAGRATILQYHRTIQGNIWGIEKKYYDINTAEYKSFNIIEISSKKLWVVRSILLPKLLTLCAYENKI